MDAEKTKEEWPEDRPELEVMAEVIARVPGEVWKKLGYERLEHVRIDGDILDVELRKDVRNFRRGPSGCLLEKTDIWWELADIYQPYHDLCLRLMERHRARLEEGAHFLDVPPREMSTDEAVTLALAGRSSMGRLFRDYFDALELEGELRSLCKKENATGLAEILGMHDGLVFYVMAQGLEKEPEQMDEALRPVKKLMEPLRGVDTAVFTRRFLTAGVSPKNIQRDFGYICEILREYFGEAAFRLYQDLRAVDDTKRDYFLKDLTERGITFLLKWDLPEYCLASASATELAIMERMEYPEGQDIVSLADELGVTEAALRFVASLIPEYGRRMQMELREFPMALERTGGTYVATVEEYGRSGYGSSGEAALEDLEQSYRKEKSVWILEKLNREYGK